MLDQIFGFLVGFIASFMMAYFGIYLIWDEQENGEYTFENVWKRVKGSICTHIGNQSKKKTKGKKVR